jgi:hypothetical protein
LTKKHDKKINQNFSSQTVKRDCRFGFKLKDEKVLPAITAPTCKWGISGDEEESGFLLALVRLDRDGLLNPHLHVAAKRWTASCVL